MIFDLMDNDVINNDVTLLTFDDARSPHHHTDGQKNGENEHYAKKSLDEVCVGDLDSSS